MKILVTERPNMGEIREPFDPTDYRFDRFDITDLENGKVVWHGDIAFSLEEE